MIWGGEVVGIVNVINLLLELEYIVELICVFNIWVLVILVLFFGIDLW